MWFNRYMTIVLVALGSSLIALTVFLLGKATDLTTTNETWWYRASFAAITLSLVAYSWALFREWKREKKEEE